MLCNDNDNDERAQLMQRPLLAPNVGLHSGMSMDGKEAREQYEGDTSVWNDA